MKRDKKFIYLNILVLLCIITTGCTYINKKFTELKLLAHTKNPQSLSEGVTSSALLAPEASLLHACLSTAKECATNANPSLTLDTKESTVEVKLEQIFTGTLPEELYTKKIVRSLCNTPSLVPGPPQELLALGKAKDPAACLQKCFLRVDNPQKIPMEIINWGSGGGNKFGTFIAPEVSEYFIKVFEYLANATHGTDMALDLNPTDLFHGHLLLEQKTSNLMVIFHAKEYPDSGFPGFKRKFQQALSTFGVENTTHFTIDTPAYKYRNFIWSLNRNCGWNIAFENYYPNNTSDYLLELFEPSDTSIIGSGLLDLEEEKMIFSTLHDDKIAAEINPIFPRPLASINYFNLLSNAPSKTPAQTTPYLFVQ